MPNKQSILTAKNGALWVQRDGPNTALDYLGCHGLGSVSAPKGAMTLLQCLNEDRQYETFGMTETPPGLITGSITAEVKKVQSVMEQIEEDNCAFALYVNSLQCAGKANVFSNFDRGFALTFARLSQVDDNNAQHHAEDAPYQQVYTFEADSDRNRYYDLAAQREVTALVESANDITSCDNNVCMAECTTPQRPGTTLFTANDSDGVGGTAPVQTSVDSGTTWANLAADPFAANAEIMSIVCFELDENTTRIVAAMDAPAGGQGMIAYSDDTGATWTTVNIGGGVAGHGAVYHGALHARGPNRLWLASEAGYIYFSADGGITWVAQEQGVISANGYRQIEFFDDNFGVAVNDTGGVVATTTNGGTTWAAGTVVTGALALNCVEMVGERYVWVGTATGLLFYSDDLCVTWNARTGFTGSGVGQVRDLYANDAYNIWMTKDTAAPLGSVLKTVDGGVNWKVVPNFPVNAGLNAIWASRNNNAVCVGEAQGGTAFIADIDPASS